MVTGIESAASTAIGFVRTCRPRKTRSRGTAMPCATSVGSPDDVRREGSTADGNLESTPALRATMPVLLLFLRGPGALP